MRRWEKDRSFRRWHAGWQMEIDGVRFRVRRGKKTPRGPGEDLVLEWFVGGRWQPIKLRIAALITDFCFENEDVLYPPSQFKGGMDCVEYLKTAVVYGWDKADALLNVERHQKPQQSLLEFRGDDVYVEDDDST